MQDRTCDKNGCRTHDGHGSSVYSGNKHRIPTSGDILVRITREAECMGMRC